MVNYLHLRSQQKLKTSIKELKAEAAGLTERLQIAQANWMYFCPVVSRPVLSFLFCRYMHTYTHTHIHTCIHA